MEKLTFQDVQEGVLQLGCGVVFEYNGKPCGVQTEVENCVFSFTMWYGKWWADYSDFQVMTHDKVFDGLSFYDLMEQGLVDPFLP